MLRATPPGEDGAPGRGVGNGAAFVPPPGENGLLNIYDGPDHDELENEAADAATDGAFDYENDEDDDQFNVKPTNAEFLQLLSEAVSQASLYSNQTNRQSWQRTYRAFLQQHFDGSKYKSKDYANRSKLFIPKTRGAIRKDLAATSASLFGSLDAINCMAGNEADKQQRASAAVLQELINYRTDRSNTQASLPWFHVALGARQTALLTGFCFSKQSWKLELRRAGTETYKDEDTGQEMQRDVWKPYIDRPDIQLIPPENVDMDPAADWTNPAQDSAYVIIKWPMRIDEIRRRQRDPRMPWLPLDESILKSGSSSSKIDPAAIRRAREQGLDRMDETATGDEFGIIWVYETFIRTAGEDWTFLSVADQHMLTEPRPVSEVYPEQMGQRPLAMGYGGFEAFRIFPMAPAESWQTLQQESNDIRNLSLDSLKQNIMPVTKVVRGRNVDMDQLKRRGQGSAIMVTNKDDVTWEKVQDLTSSVQMMSQKIDLEFDDLAGQQNYGTVDSNNNLGKTLGGLKLAAGAANAVQEFDIRVWIETFVEPVLSQLVRLEQYYESDPVVLGLCGDRAKLFQKYGVDEITDELLEQQVTIRCNVGLGAGDPQQRLQKFQTAASIMAPLLAQSKDFQTGKKELDWEAAMGEVFGAAGYRDGGKRFVKDGTPQGPNPQADATTDKLKAEAEYKRAMAKKAIIDAIVNAAEIGLQEKQQLLTAADQAFDQHMTEMDLRGRAADLGLTHAERLMAIKNVAKGLAPDGSPIDTPEEEAQVAQIKAEQGMGGADAGGGMDSLASAVGGPEMAPASPEAIPAAADAPGAGNVPLQPGDVSRHGVPAANAGEQRQQDAAEGQGNLDKAIDNAPKPKRRTINITKRGPDGRAAEFEVMEH